jgi:protein-tyrosine-phosphatase
VSDDKINVLFVDKDNSIRSIVALALLDRFAGNRFRTFSAGLHPAPEIHPRTIEMLNTQGLPIEYHRPRCLSEFLHDTAPEMDLVINLSGELLPCLPGNPQIARWRITDPLFEKRDPLGQLAAFRRTFRELENRIRLFALLRHPMRRQRLAAGPLGGASMQSQARAVG